MTLNLNIDTADISVEAPAWSGSPIDAAKSFVITPGAISVAGDVETGILLEFLDTEFPVEFTQSADLDIKPYPIRLDFGSIIAGDFPDNAFFVVEGAKSWNWESYTVDTDDDTLAADSTATKSCWVRSRQNVTGLIELTGGGGYWRAYSARDLGDIAAWTELGSGILDSNPDYITASAYEDIFFRIEPTTGATVSANVLLDVVPFIPEIMMTVNPVQIDQSPSTIRVSVSGVEPFETVEFSIVGVAGTAYSEEADETGQINGAGLPIPSLDAGTYEVLASREDGSSATAGFSILLDSPSRPTTQPADLAPLAVPEAVLPDVQRWVLQDPTGDQFIFPLNPTEMESPHPARVVTIETTVGIDGQAILWEAARRAHDWSFSGWTDDEAVYTALEAFKNLRHRFWLIDHRNRAWAVSFTAIDWKPKRIPGRDWSFEYSVTAQIYKGPVEPT
jgi:hypothetical protein